MSSLNHHGLRFVLLAWVLSIVVSLARANAGEAPNEERIWDRLKAAEELDQPSGPLRWAVVEGVPLIRRPADVPAEYVAAASVLCYFNSARRYEVDRLFNGDSRVLDTVYACAKEAADTQGISGEQKTRTVQECGAKYMKVMTELGKARKALRDKQPADEQRETMGATLARLVYGTRQRNDESVAETAQAFLKARLYLPRVRAEKAPYDTCMTLVDDGTPFVMFAGADRRPFVCIGYLREKDANYVIACDPAEVEWDLRSHADLMAGKGDFVERLRSRMDDVDKQLGKVRLDYEFSVASARGRKGIHILVWEGAENIMVIPELQVSKRLVKDICGIRSRDIGQ